MIDQQKLEAVRVIVTHDACSDGLASALVCKDVLHDARVHFALHGKPSHDELVAEPHMLFVDIAPPPGREQQFLDAGAIVLDHHKGAQAVVQKFVDAGLGVFADEKEDPGISGAMLAFLEVYCRLEFDARTHRDHVKDLARLIGIRDTWQTADPDWELAQVAHNALMFYPRDRFLLGGHACLMPDDMAVGRIVYEGHLETVRRASDKVFVSDYPGCRLAIFNEIGLSPRRMTSDLAELLRVERGVNVLAGFHYEGANLCVSMRSDGSVDVAAFAKSKGGGGHTAAAGYRAGSEDRSPHFRIMRDFEKWRSTVVPTEERA